MKVGDYVRTENGIITRITDIREETEFFNEGWSSLSSTYTKYYNTKNISININMKSSPNIIDLIEVGDYVNGHRVIEIDNKGKDIFDKYLLVEEVDYDDCNISYANNEIKSIVTKEQFESMEYKVGE